MPVDPNVANSILAAWGAPGAIILILLGGFVWTAMKLLASFNERHAELKELLESKYKESADTVEVLRDLRTSIDAQSKTMDATIAILQAQAHNTQGTHQ